MQVQHRGKLDRAVRSVAMSDVVPSIREGIIDPASGGMRLPELTVEDGSARLDDRMSGRFALLSIEPLTAPVLLADLPVEIIVAGNDVGPLSHFATWLESQGANWALIRPDRYVHSIGGNDPELRSAVSLLARQLGLQAHNADTSEKSQ